MSFDSMDRFIEKLERENAVGEFVKKLNSHPLLFFKIDPECECCKHNAITINDISVKMEIEPLIALSKEEK